MDLNILWFVLIGVLFTGFFFLEGFDYGVGILLPVLGKDDIGRRVVINTIGPHWDGNEVWMITAGGAIFAAFPHWYATMFSGFYIALTLMLAALILRGVAFELRSKFESPTWRQRWDWAIIFGSFVPALLWGVAFTNLVRGVPINEEMTYVGGFLDLLNPYSLLGGVVSLLIFTLHGAAFLLLKLEGEMRDHARKVAEKVWLPTVIALVVFAAWGYFELDLRSKLGMNPGVIPMASVASLLVGRYFLREKKDGTFFILTSLNIVFMTITAFMALFPNVMISSLGDAYNLTIYNASSTQYTLTVMSIVAGLMVPVVLVYQAWSYWIFRQRISRASHLEY
ncbi:MAG: cytochrome d ubiquinol oxidase subunit II [Myxococcota bacterium]|jgi:cytochrome d ubiquinol oxidase subunit II|nr:cytochrome d ubiquinol oxidase subunit II [Myxococcota bacterium]